MRLRDWCKAASTASAARLNRRDRWLRPDCRARACISGKIVTLAFASGCLIVHRTPNANGKFALGQMRQCCGLQRSLCGLKRNSRKTKGKLHAKRGGS
jgi:hypothetical protein